MPCCMVADVRAMVDTALTDREITGIIETSDTEIDRRIGVQDSSDRLVKKLSMLVTAHAISAWQPYTQVIGEDAGNGLRVLEREIERIYGLYGVPRVKASEYEEICELERH